MQARGDVCRWLHADNERAAGRTALAELVERMAGLQRHLHQLGCVSSSSSSSSLHFQLRPACGLHEYTCQAALEHAQATITTIATISLDGWMDGWCVKQ
jgi:hypothetical protein